MLSWYKSFLKNVKNQWGVVLLLLRNIRRSGVSWSLFTITIPDDFSKRDVAKCSNGASAVMVLQRLRLCLAVDRRDMGPAQLVFRYAELLPGQGLHLFDQGKGVHPGPTEGTLVLSVRPVSGLRP